MIGTAAALLGSAAIGAGSSIFGAMSANSAASKQADAAAQANAILQSRYQEAQTALLPYYKAGEGFLSTLQQQMPSLTAPIVMDQSTLEQTPGYQFNLSQGLRGAQNALTASGLANSGAASKAAARFATGLADSTYQNQFNNAQINRQTAYNMLLGPTQIGANAAASFAGDALGVGNAQGQNVIGAGNAAAAGTLAGANFLNQGANNIGSNLLLSSLLGRNGGNGMYGNAADAGYGNGVGTGGFNFLDNMAG
jgi:hypothetical protein